MMLTPCGPSAVPTGGAGVAAPAFSATLTSAATFFFGGISVVLLGVPRAWVPAAVRGRGYPAGCHLCGSDLLDLREGQVDRGLATQDLDQRLEPLAVHVDLGDRGVHARERTVHHHDGVTDREVGHLDLLLAPGRR